MSSIIDLIQDNLLSELRKTLKNDPSLVHGSGSGDQPIHVAAADNKAKIVKLLLQFGANVNARDDDERTPLHRAAELGPETIKELLQHGADVNVVDKWGYTPLAWAISGQQPEGEKVVKMLRNAGAPYHLTEAAALGDLAAVKSILESDPNAIANVPSAETLLSMAVTVRYYGSAEDRLEIARLVLDNGLDLPKKSLLRYASACETRGIKDIAQLLKKYAKKAKK